MTSDVLPLRGMRCDSCGLISTPVQNFGCRRCGAHDDDFVVTELDGKGEVLAAVTVHQHPSSEVTVPLVVGSVLLDDGPVVRARLDENSPAGAPVAARQLGDVLVFIDDAR